MTVRVLEKSEVARAPERTWRVRVVKVNPDGECMALPISGHWADGLTEDRRVRITFRLTPQEVEFVLGKFSEEQGLPIMELKQSQIVSFEQPLIQPNGALRFS